MTLHDLELEEVGRDFGAVRVLDRVSCTIAGGAITGLIGPNGAGKSTLFDLIAGSRSPSRGRIRFAGRRIEHLPPHRRHRAGIARGFQVARPFLGLSVLENVMLAAPGQAGELFWRNWLTPGAVARGERAVAAEAMALLEFVGLADLARAEAAVLSGGQRKLLDLARLLLGRPRLILLDEPGAGVAPALLERIMERIATVNRRGVGFLIIEHNLDLVMRLCSRVLVMAEGRILTAGTAEEVRADPRVARAWLGP